MLTTKTAAAILAFAATALAQVEPYHQCGGNGYTGDSSCVAGWECAVSNEWYSQCLPAKGGDSGAVGEDDEEVIEDEDDCLEEVPEEDEEVIGEEDDCLEELPEDDVEEPVEEDDCPEEEEGEAEEDDEEEAPAVTSSASPATSTPASTPASSAPTATSDPDVPETPETPETPAGECSAPSGSNQVIGFGSGTTGGGDGEGVTVTSCSEFESALEAGGVIKISGTLDGCDILKVNSDTSIIGVGADATITNGGLRFKDVTNVIVQNIKFHLSPEGKDLIDIESSTYIWVDHCDFSNVGITGDKDYYDGMLDIKRGSDFITVSWSVFSDHWKASLIGHSPSNGDQDSGALHVTYHHNLWSNINSRAPSIRFGTVHVYSNCYEDVPTSGVNSREEAQVLVEHSSFTNVRRAIVTDLDANLEGFANERDNLYVESDTEITQEGSWEPEYSYTPDPASCVCELLKSSAGVGVVA